MKWVDGFRYDEFERKDGSKYYAGLTHRCPECNTAIVSIPDDIDVEEHDCYEIAKKECEKCNNKCDNSCKFFEIIN